MYLLIISLLMLIIPFLVIPRHMAIGAMSPYRIVLYSTLTIASLTALVFMIAAFTGEGLYAQLYAVAKLMSEQAAADPMLIEAFDLADASEADRAAMFAQMYDSSLKRFPAMIIFLSAIESYIVYIVMSKPMKKKHQIKEMPKYREFSFPHGAAMAIMIMYLISWIMMSFDMPNGEMMYININMLFDIMFSLQGIAVVFMFFHFRKVPQAVSVIVSGIMWVTAFGKMFLVLLGMADLFLGVRGWMAAKRRR